MPCDTGQERTDQNQSAKRENGGIRTPTDVIHISFRHCDSWLSLLPDVAFVFSTYHMVAGNCEICCVDTLSAWYLPHIWYNQYYMVMFWLARKLPYTKKRQMLSAIYLSTISQEPVWGKSLICSSQRAFPHRQGTPNGSGQPWISSWQIKSMSLSLVWSYTWMLNLKRIAGAIWIMTRPDIREKQPGISLLHLQWNSSVQIPLLLLYL